MIRRSVPTRNRGELVLTSDAEACAVASVLHEVLQSAHTGAPATPRTINSERFQRPLVRISVASLPKGTAPLEEPGTDTLRQSEPLHPLLQVDDAPLAVDLYEYPHGA